LRGTIAAGTDRWVNAQMPDRTSARSVARKSMSRKVAVHPWPVGDCAMTAQVLVDASVDQLVLAAFLIGGFVIGDDAPWKGVGGG
jgi:hypothetical protein